MAAKEEMTTVDKMNLSQPAWQDYITFYKKLMIVDSTIASLVASLRTRYIRYRMSDLGKSTELIQTVVDPRLVYLSGSCSDGGCVCRWFQHESVIPDLEFDIMLPAISIPAEHQRQLLTWLPAKPGYVKVKHNQCLYDCIHPEVRRYTETHRPDLHGVLHSKTDDVYLNTCILKEHFEQETRFKDGDNMIAQAFGALISCEASEVSVSIHEEITGPSAMTGVMVSNQDSSERFLFSCDKVIAVKLESWPEVIQEWLIRDRQNGWPDIGLVDECQKLGCFLVAKRSPKGTKEADEEDDQEEWRLSFSALEMTLMKSWSPNQMICYIIVKSLYYKYLKPLVVDDIHIPSYVIKTLMLWDVEQTKASVWTEENIPNNVSRILTKVKDGLYSGTIPNYFLPTMNIIDPAVYPTEVCRKAADYIATILQDITASLPCDHQAKLDLGDRAIFMLEVAVKCLQFLEEQAKMRAEFGGPDQATKMVSIVQAFLLLRNMNLEKQQQIQDYTELDTD